MAKDIWSVCGKVENYKSTYNGIDWTDPKNNAWSNFPQLPQVSRNYIKTLWNDWNKQGDPGKFIFFDIVNLSPTIDENYGYQIKSIPNERKDFYVNIPIPIDQKTKKPAYKYVPSGIFKQLQSQQKNSNGKKTESEIQGIILNNIQIDEDDIKHPAESEFKLTWMRDLVERGVEGVMGPFVASLKSDGSPNKTSDGRVIFKIDQNSLDRFINNRTDYKEAIWKDWLQSQLDFATKDPKGYNNSPYPKVSLKDLQTLSNGGKLSEDGKEQFVMTEAISGQLTSNTKGKDVFQKLALGANGQPIFRDGVMAKVNPNYTISGWIKIPGIYGDKQLPWPFVWRYIGREGIWQKSVWETSGGKGTFMPSDVSVVEKIDIDAKKQNSKNIPSHVPYIANGSGPSYSFLAFDARSRFWHHRYSTKDIPSRELIFLIRYKYGAAGSVGERFISDDNITAISIDTPNEWAAIRQCGGVPIDGVYFSRGRGTRTGDKITVTYEPYKNDGNTYKLRSKYVCQIHDTVGWNRFGGGGTGHVLPDNSGNNIDIGTALTGDPTQIVKYDGTNQGYYSFTGGTSDRNPIQEGQTDATDDYSLYEYKRDFKLDVQANHISLWMIVTDQTKSDDGLKPDDNDRFVTPDFIISDTKTKDGKKTIYHNHGKNYILNYKDAFYPGLYTNKELQFLYELISYCYYGVDNKELAEDDVYTIGGEQTRNIFYYLFNRNYLDNSSYKHRWRELGSYVSLKSESVIMDYILWASPTNEQFNKSKFSELKDTFVERYKNILSTSGMNWTSPIFYPVHNFAKEIYQSEESNRPTVPAWVHYNYISRLLNTGENSFNKEINDDDVRRVFGGIHPRFDINHGQLIALPSFVLMGRVDLGESESTWPSGWGDCPFSKDINGNLIVGNLDTVLDKWAKQHLHNGKYVSAMEILFWLRYKRGIASAPTQRTIRFPINRTGVEKINYTWTKENKNYWPKEAFVFVEGNSRRVSFESFGAKSLEDGDILPTETLHNIPILTSYYHPIYSDGNSEVGVKIKNSDPLMEIETPEKIKGKPLTSYTGWNSKYVAHWPGATEIPSTSLRQKDLLTAFFVSDFPNNSKLNYSHLKPSQLVFDYYISNQEGQKYNTTKGLVYGFDRTKLINTSDIQSWFRAIKILQIYDTWAKYVADGLQKQEGERGSVIPVKATIHNKDTNESSETLLFISGDPNGEKYNISNSFDKENLINRPWEFVFQNQPELDALLSDYSLGVNNCIPQYRYMRHIIQPLDFMYFFPKTEKNPNAFYSSEQTNNTIKWSIRMIPTKSMTGFGVDSFENMDKLSLRALVLTGCGSTKLGSDLLKKKDFFGKKMDSISFYLKQSYEGVWWAGKIGKVIWTSSGIGTRVYVAGESFFNKLGKSELVQRSKNLEDFFKYKLDYPLTYAKWGLKFFNDAWNGKIDETSLFYFSKEGIVKFYGDYVKSDIVKHAFQKEIEKIMEGIGKKSVRESLNLARLASAANVGLTLLYELISWQADLAIENYKNENKIEDMWSLLNEATKNNFLEGIYMESKGTIRISKNITGTIPSNFDTVSIQNQGIKKLPSQLKTNEFWSGPVPQPGDPKLQEFITNHNTKFYEKPNGLAYKIGKNLKSGSCECQFLTSLFAKTPTFKNDSNYKFEDKGTPYNRKNWKNGPFIRQWINRESIVDDAPTYSDMPITFATSERPKYDTEWFPFEKSSTQISDLQQPGVFSGVKGRAKNMRVNGQGGTIAVSMNDCPRFWWPNILHIPVSDDLCKYMAIDGNYPTNPPEIYRMCDGLFDGDLRMKIARERNRKEPYFPNVQTYSRSRLSNQINLSKESNTINYFDINAASNTDIGLLHTDYVNDKDNENKIFLGNTIISIQGVNGIAPPHEREIVRLFRKKYGIDIVNPNNNCCSINEVLDDATENSKDAINLRNKQDDAIKCEYIIKLNTKEFHTIVKNSCLNNTTSDNSQEQINIEKSKSTSNNIPTANISVIDSQVISGSVQLSPDPSLIAGGWSDNKRRKKARRKNPCIPGCVDCCDDDRPVPPGVEVSQRQIAIENADTTFANSPSANLGRFRIINRKRGEIEEIAGEIEEIAGALTNIGSSIWSTISCLTYTTKPVPMREPVSTPLQPADEKKVKEWREYQRSIRETKQPPSDDGVIAGLS